MSIPQRNTPHSFPMRRVVYILVALLILLIAATITTTLIAKSQLETAKDDIKEMSSTLAENPKTTVGDVYASFSGKLATAQTLTELPSARVFEWVPLVGRNLAAFRETTETLNAFSLTGIKPVVEQLSDVSYGSLQPVNGSIDIKPFTNLTEPSKKLASAISTASARFNKINTANLIPLLGDNVKKVSAALKAAGPYAQRFTEIAPLIGQIMGESTPRHYLLLFQNNAEERASGGNPGVLAVLTVDNGRISLTKQASASEGFPHPYSSPVLNYDENWNHIYGNHVTTYISNITWMPNFPTTAALAIKMWQLQFGANQKVDGVISFDPVALSYLLKGTGPIKLSSGDTIDSNNAVKFLLSDIYSKYPNPKQEDKIFNSAAVSIFSALTSGKGSLGEYLKAFKPIIAEQRLKLWSANEAEEAQLVKSPVSGILPKDNSDATTLGVYYNDDATSKMSYYMNATIDASTTCKANKPVYTVSTTVSNTAPSDAATTLPAYVLTALPDIPLGWDRQYVMFYGPVGAKFNTLEVNGKAVTINPEGGYPYDPAVVGTDEGRPVAIARVLIPNLSALTVTATFTGSSADSSKLQVFHTPKVRNLPVTMSSETCN